MDDLTAVAHELSLLHVQLAKLINEVIDASGNVGFAWGAAPNERKLQNSPVNGSTRLIVPNRQRGSSSFIMAPAVYYDLVPANSGRGGLSIQNIGAGSCYVFFTQAENVRGLANDPTIQQVPLATGYLPAGSGGFDGKLSSELWCGPISVFSEAGTTLIWAEV